MHSEIFLDKSWSVSDAPKNLHCGERVLIIYHFLRISKTPTKLSNLQNHGWWKRCCYMLLLLVFVFKYFNQIKLTVFQFWLTFDFNLTFLLFIPFMKVSLVSKLNLSKFIVPETLLVIHVFHDCSDNHFKESIGSVSPQRITLLDVQWRTSVLIHCSPFFLIHKNIQFQERSSELFVFLV